MENLRGHIIHQFEPDYVLMDARTGISELGGIATHQLADYVVLLFNLNEQNLQGAKRFHDSVKKLKKPPKIILAASPIPSMPAGEGTPFRKKMNWVKRSLSHAENSDQPIVIPYQPRLSWEECILVDDREDPFGSDHAYCELGDKVFAVVLDPEAAKKKAGELWQEDKLDKATEILKQADEQTPEGYARLGFVLAEDNKHEEAITAYEKAVEMKPDYALAWNNLGSSLHDTKQFAEAIIAYYKAIEIKPDDEDAWYNLGLALHEIKQFTEAIGAFNKAIDLKPYYEQAWYTLACSYSLQDDKKSALSNLEKAIQLDSTCKQDAQEDEDFKPFWNDPDFKRIVGAEKGGSKKK